jgi:hypothetical protein
LNDQGSKPTLKAMANARFLVGLAAVGLAALTVTAPATTRTSGYWIVLTSNRDGQQRGYGVRPDGSRLTPLLPYTSTLVPAGISGDTSTIQYYDSYGDAGYVSRANGTALRRLPKGSAAVLSRDGRLVAFQKNDGVWIADVDGRGPRRLTSDPREEPAAWAPDGKSVLLLKDLGSPRYALLIQPLQGKPRWLVRGAISKPAWSPSGRWIAYAKGENGVYVVRADGTRRARVVRGYVWDFGWSPVDRLASVLGTGSRPRVTVVGAVGRGVRELPMPGLKPGPVRWSPDERLIAVESDAFGDGGSQVWVIGADGSGLRHVTNGGTNHLVGWTRRALMRRPALPLLPSERVLGATVVETRRPVADLAADGPRVAFVAKWTASDCDHVAVWTPASRTLHRFGAVNRSCKPWYGEEIEAVELAGTRAAWTYFISCGMSCEVVLKTESLAGSSPVAVATAFPDIGEQPGFNVHGHGGLLVFDDERRLVRIGTGHERCAHLTDIARPARICSTLRRGAHASPVGAAAGGLIAIREPAAVSIVDATGKLVRTFPFGRGEVTAARLDGGHLVVARADMLQVYDAKSGAVGLERQLPDGYRLTDVDGGIAVLRHGYTIMLLRLVDGHSLSLNPGRGPKHADLESSGLYYSYATLDGRGRIVFLPRAELVQQLR